MIELFFSSITEIIGLKNIYITVMHSHGKGIIQNHLKLLGELEENPRMSLREKSNTF